MDWKNQFEAVESSELLRTTVEIPHLINAQIKQYEPKTGVLQNTISILIQKLSDELRKSSLEPGDRYGYQRAIAGIRLTLDCPERDSPLVRGTGVQPSTGSEHPVTGQADSGDVGRRTPKLARKTPRAPKPSNFSRAHEQHLQRKSKKDNNQEGT